MEQSAIGLHRRYWNARRYVPAQTRYLLAKQQIGPDQIPFPPPRLIYLVTGLYDTGYFFENGVKGARSIQSVLRANGLDIDRFGSVLDFGCGCGRIMRHWAGVKGPNFSGTDYNPRLVQWCRDHLSFAKFGRNELHAPLIYEDGAFDFVYAISVFTHLSVELQHFWISELARILKPNGYLLITIHGRSRFVQMTPDEIERFEAGQLVVRTEQKSGTNFCSAYHPEVYVRRSLARNLNVVDFVPVGAQDANQDVYLFQKP